MTPADFLNELLSIESKALVLAAECKKVREKLSVEKPVKPKKDYSHILEKRHMQRIRKQEKLNQVAS